MGNGLKRLDRVLVGRAPAIVHSRGTKGDQFGYHLAFNGPGLLWYPEHAVRFDPSRKPLARCNLTEGCTFSPGHALICETEEV